MHNNRDIQIKRFELHSKRDLELFRWRSQTPYLIKKYGTVPIEKVTLHKPSARSFKAIEELNKTFTIKEVAIPYFKKKLSRYGWKCFYALKNTIQKDGGKFTRVKEPPRP